MYQKVKALSSRLAEAKSMDMRSTIIVVLLTAFLSSITISLFDINRVQMLILSGIFLLMAGLSVAGYHAVASWGALFSAQYIVSTFLFSNFGIRDTAMLGLIAILICAGLLAGKTGTVVIGSAIIFEIAILGVLESRGIVLNKFSSDNNFSDYITLIVTISMITLIQWLVIGRLNNIITNAEKELTERKKFEAQLQEAEGRYRGLVESIPLVTYMAEPGIKGKWHFISPQITELTGFAPQEWLDDPGFWYSRVHPDDRDQTMKDEADALRKGRTPVLEYRLLTKDGRTVWVSDKSLVFLDMNTLLVQGFMLDITKRKRAEEQLTKHIAELQAVRGVSETLIQRTDLHKLIFETGEQIRFTFKANNVLIAIHDPNTNLINFPYDFEGARYRPNLSIKYGEGITTQIMNMKKPFFIHENWKEESEKLHVININKIPILSSMAVPIMINDRVLGLITLESTEREHAFNESDVPLLSTIAANLAVAIENTRLQDSLKQELDIQERLVRELELKNAELERFTYTASHDLKSPLITIRGFLGYLKQDAQNGNFERLNSDIQRISDATEKMHRLLNELLELSRIGRVANEAQNIPFSEIVEDALQRVEGQLKGNQVQVTVGSGFPVVRVDRERMVEVIQNLVDNATKFFGDQPSPQIEIGYKTEADQTIFFVRDNGIGIKREFHERIFGLFDKLDATSTGTGVGLALVKRIVEVHGGKIWVESEEGAGSTFCFTLGNTNL
ncbi:MAG: PAS domain-containing protein [Anaerolineales bacterium]|nr:PAS domain-containing protein [Anaerolineales bacterium]